LEITAALAFALASALASTLASTCKRLVSAGLVGDPEPRATRLKCEVSGRVLEGIVADILGGLEEGLADAAGRI
jgi:hypothetical protein